MIAAFLRAMRTQRFRGKNISRDHAARPGRRGGWAARHHGPGLGLPGGERKLNMSDMTEIRLAERMGRLGTESAFEVLARAKALEAAGKTVIHLEIGEPDAGTPPHVVAAAEEALARGLTHYVPSPGIPELRAAVARHLSAAGRLETTP